MDDRLALRQAPMPAPHDTVAAAAHDADENEDEKVYYGFGVFMGLPLADLKAMKEEFMHQQSTDLRNALPPASAIPPSTNGASARSTSVEYSAGRSATGGHEYTNGRGAAGNVPGVVPPVALGNNRMHAMAPAPAAHANQVHYNSARPPPRAIGREYDASQADDDDAALSDEGSDGSYSAPKSHSLNFILH